MTTKTPYTLAAHRNGQTSIRLDTVALHAAAGCKCHGSNGNAGTYNVSPWSHGQQLDLKSIGANLRAAYPGARVRVTTRRVIVRPTVAMLDDVATLDVYWQEMASMGATPAEMQHDTINRVEYHRHAATVAVLS